MAGKKNLRRRAQGIQLAAALFILLYILLAILTKMPQPMRLSATGTAVGSADFTINALCSFNLASNWNFISFCANPADKAVTSVLSSVSGKYDYLLRWNATAQAYELYSIYSGSKPFSDIEVNRSYFIHMTSPKSGFSVSGDVNTDMNISLREQWNAPSWPYEFSTNVVNYLAPIDGKWEYLMKWNSSSQSYILYSVYASNKPFNQIYVGEGQFMHINTSSATLVYERASL